MFKLFSPETTELLINIAIISLGSLAIIFVLRKVFRVAWKVIKFLLIVVGILVLVGLVAGWLKISFL